jgi:hypothetical protein
MLAFATDPFLGAPAARPIKPRRLRRLPELQNRRRFAAPDEEQCMKRQGALTAAMAILFGAEASQAQSKSANELAKQCIADDKSPCSRFILGSIGALENGRRVRGEPTCLSGDPPSDEIVKVFVRAILASYPYDELPASVLIENIYKDKCKKPN